MKPFVFVLTMILYTQTFAQWSKTWGEEKSFIENKGQFEELYAIPDRSPILYAFDGDKEDYFFTKNKLVFRFIQVKMKEKEENEYEEMRKFAKKGFNAEEWHRHEVEELRGKVIKEFITAEWIGANPNVEVIAEEPTTYYHNYSFKKDNIWHEINYIPSYKKITYKNLYPNIDVVYEFHPKGGIKYSIYIHPGGDVSKIKLRYSKPIKINRDGNIVVKFKSGQIMEHAPISFYNDNKEKIASSFVEKNNTISFQFNESVKSNQTIVIDPWVVSSTFNTSTAVWEVETDQSGNVYVIGGETPMKLQKYNSTGALQWTYTTSWDTASVWLGTLATDNVGNSYITSGTAPEIKKVSPAGAQVWTNSGLNNTCEYWSITFNCDKSKLIVGGTYVANPLSMDYSASIYDIDINNGNVLGHAEFETTNIGGVQIPPVTPIEVRSISASKNAKYLFLTHTKVGAINQNISQCPNDVPVFQVDNGHHLGYKCENYLPATQNGGGLKAIISNDNYVYTHAGDKIYKRSLFDGSLLGQANIPGGGVSSSLGQLVVKNSGLAVDDCGNVYAGSQNKVVKFDPDLNILGQYNVSISVYDVAVNNNGEVIAVGAQSDNQAASRNGKIESVNASACAQYYPVCCDANICPVDPLCPTDAPINLTGGTPGGTWSGSGITNASTGTFDPSVAGVGSHTVYYTLPCGTDSVIINVLACTPITVCYDGTNLQATGGSNTIQWQTQTQTTSTPANAAECIACGGTPVTAPIIGTYLSCNPPVCTITTWNTYATGYTASPPSSWPLQVTDGTNTLNYTSLSQIPSCGNCTPPTLSNTVFNETCANAHNGSINLTVTGSSTYSYQWTGPNGFTANVEDPSNLAPGTYNVTVTDATNSTCTATATITVNAGSPNPTPTISGSTTFCTGSSTTLDAGSYSSYLWSNNETTQTITVNTAGPYSVTVTNAAGCTGVASVNVTQSNSLSPHIVGTLAICSGASTILDAGAGFANYLWSTTDATQTITVSTAGQYSVTVSDAGGCTGTDQVTVQVSTNPTPTISGNTNICAGSSTTLDAGNGYTTYLWSNNAQTQTINVNTAGNFSVTVTNSDGCSGSTQVTVNITSNPNANAGIDDDTCGLSYTLHAIPSGGSTGIWTYSGPGTATFSSNTDPQATVTVSTAGVYYFIWTETVSSNCTGSDTVKITFYTTPTSSFTASTIHCTSQSSTITYTGTASSTATYNWSWDGGTATPGNGMGPHAVSWNNPGTYSISLTVSEHGCTSTPTTVQVINPSGMTSTITKTDILCYGQTSGSINLTVNGGTTPYTYHWNNGATVEDLINIPSGTYSVTITDAGGCTTVNGTSISSPNELTVAVTPSQSICYGQSANLNITATGGTAPYTFYWNNQVSNPDITITPSSTITYSGYAMDANGCMSNQISTTVYVSGPVHVDLIANPTKICPGEVVLLTPVIYGGLGAPYIIYNQNGDVVTNPIYIYPNHTGYYWIKGEDACGAWDSAGVTITVLPLPPAGALADTVQGCMPLTVNFIEVNPDSGRSFVWDFGDHSNLSLAKNPTHTYTYAGTFNVTLTVTSPNGCKTVNTYNNMITVWPAPNAQFIWNPEFVSEVKPIVDFTNLSTLAETYRWIFGDGDSTNLMNPSHRFPHSGNYEVLLLAYTDKGCVDSAKAIIKVLEEYTFYAPTGFSPNNDGVNDYFFIMAHSIVEEDFKIEVYDRWGEIIWSSNKFDKETESSDKWDGSVKGGKIAPVGTYTWRVLFRDSHYRLHEETGAINIIR